MSADPPPLDILIVSDIRLYREGLELVLADDAFRVVATTSVSRATIAVVRERKPDVVLLDMGSGDSRVLVHGLAKLPDKPAVVALTVGDDDGILSCVESGVLGYVTREASVDDLEAAIRSAARGELLCSAQIAGGLAQRLAVLRNGASGPAQLSSLTPREHEVLGLVGEGRSNKEIARDLSIAVATVKNHVHAIFAKLGVGSRREAARAWRNSWPGPRRRQAPS